MEKLIEALRIFLKYKNENFPTHCEHEILLITGISEEEVSEEDREKLEKLSFYWDDEYEAWASTRYGSS